MHDSTIQRQQPCTGSCTSSWANRCARSNSSMHAVPEKEAAGPVAEGAADSAASYQTSSDCSAARPPQTLGGEPCNQTRVNCARAPPVDAVQLAPAASFNASMCGLAGQTEGLVQRRPLQRMASGLPVAGVLGSRGGRHTHDSSLHCRTSKASQMSWETPCKQDSAGARWTCALLFPTTVEGFLARVRWQAFQQDVTQLAEQMMRLHQTAKNVMLHLPGPAGVADPTVVPDEDM